MSEVEFKSWEEVIIDFFENKIENIKYSNPKISCELYKAKKNITKKENDINKEKDENKLKNLIKAKEKKQEAPSTEIRNWIDITSKKKIKKDVRIIKATHVLKFTHSSSDNEGVLLTKKSDDKLLSTSSIKKKLILDLAHNNGNLISISRFLALELNNKPIFDSILDSDFKFLEPFKKNKEQLNNWTEGFSDLVEQREIKTADKAKQLYFPFKPNTTKDYHLITPLFPSSLAQEINNVITDIKYSKIQKEIREQKQNKEDKPKYHRNDYINFPDLAMQRFGGDNPQNVSMLNVSRSGKCFLFSTQPPNWHSSLKPPVNKKSMFDNYYKSQNIQENINYLREFLLRFKSLNLSIKDPKRKKHLISWVNSIIDDFLFYFSSIQNLPAGWSDAKNIKLKIEHQYLLDPYKQDKDFQAKRKTQDWQKAVCSDFARWLNSQLKGKDKKFTPQQEHSKIWNKLITKKLREFNDGIGDEL